MPRRHSTFWLRRDVSCISVTAATITRSTGSHRMKPRLIPSAWKHAARPTRLTGCARYSRHARIIYRRAALLMEHLPAPVSFYRQFRRRRTPIAGTDFILDQGRIDILPGAQFSDTAAILRIFSLMATHGYALSQAAEDRITDALPALAIHIPEGPYLWNALREVLLGPHAAHALRTMHALGVLEMLLPEFHGIDALVIRDSYHRYTVDEHTFLVIDNIHGLRQPTHDYEQRLAQLLPEIDRLDLFLLALLLHHTGKARRTGEHTGQSGELA